MEGRNDTPIRRVLSASRINRAFQTPIPAISRHSLSYRISRAAESGFECELPRVVTSETSSKLRPFSLPFPRLFCSGSLEPHISTALRHPVQTQRIRREHGWETEAVSRSEATAWHGGQLVQLSRSIAVSNGASLSASVRGSSAALSECRLSCGYDGQATTPSWLRGVAGALGTPTRNQVAVHANLLSNLTNHRLTLESSLGTPATRCVTALVASSLPWPLASGLTLALGASSRLRDRLLLCTRWSYEGGRHMWLAQPVWSLKGGNEVSLLLTRPAGRSPLACLQMKHKLRSASENGEEKFVDVKLFVDSRGQIALRFKASLGETNEKLG